MKYPVWIDRECHETTARGTIIYRISCYIYRTADSVAY